MKWVVEVFRDLASRSMSPISQGTALEWYNRVEVDPHLTDGAEASASAVVTTALPQTTQPPPHLSMPGFGTRTISAADAGMRPPGLGVVWNDNVTRSNSHPLEYYEAETGRGTSEPEYYH